MNNLVNPGINPDNQKISNANMGLGHGNFYTMGGIANPNLNMNQQNMKMQNSKTPNNSNNSNYNRKKHLNIIFFTIKYDPRK